MRKSIVITKFFVIIWIIFLGSCIKINKAPDSPAKPTGPSSGYLDSVYSFSTITSDPNGDGISYRFNWGDGDTSEWSSWLVSGTPYSLGHSWLHSGSFFITSQAKDKNEKKSDWSQSHNINIIAPFWVRTFGGTDDDRGYSVQQTSDGGYIIGGITRSFGASNWGDVYLIKTDVDGNQIWAKIYDAVDSYQRLSVQQTTDGGYIIIGHSVIKTNQNGDTVWTKQYRGESGQQTSDGGYIIVGNTSSAPGEIYLIKTDANGNQTWIKTFGGTSGDVEGYSVEQTSDNGYIIAGYTEFNHDVYLIKTDVNGNQTWTQNFGGTDFDYGNSVRQTSDGGYIIVGCTYSFDVGGGDMYLIKTDANGNQTWTQNFGGTSFECGYSVQQTTDGGYIVAGSTTSYGTGGDVYLIKTSINGNDVWTKTFGGTSGEVGFSVQQTVDGGYIITGSTSSFGAGESDVYLIKTDANGNTK